MRWLAVVVVTALVLVIGILFFAHNISSAKDYGQFYSQMYGINESVVFATAESWRGSAGNCQWFGEGQLLCQGTVVDAQTLLPTNLLSRSADESVFNEHAQMLGVHSTSLDEDTETHCVRLFDRKLDEVTALQVTTAKLISCTEIASSDSLVKLVSVSEQGAVFSVEGTGGAALVNLGRDEIPREIWSCDEAHCSLDVVTHQPFVFSKSISVASGKGALTVVPGNSEVAVVSLIALQGEFEEVVLPAVPDSILMMDDTACLIASSRDEKITLFDARENIVLEVWKTGSCIEAGLCASSEGKYLTFLTSPGSTRVLEIAPNARSLREAAVLPFCAVPMDSVRANLVPVWAYSASNGCINVLDLTSWKLRSPATPSEFGRRSCLYSPRRERLYLRSSDVLYEVDATGNGDTVVHRPSVLSDASALCSAPDGEVCLLTGYEQGNSAALRYLDGRRVTAVRALKTCTGALNIVFRAWRSEERRVGKECTLRCRSRWSPYH